MPMRSRHRQKTLWIGALALLGLWLVAGVVFYGAHRSKVTAEKVLRLMNETDPAALDPVRRRQALEELARQINALPPEERRLVRFGGPWDRWFNQMSEQEKGEFIEQTMPSGFKQMLASFERLSDEKRRKTVEDALRDLRRARDEIKDEGRDREAGTNQPPILSEELQKKVVGIGLNAFYSQSSAQTKAELAPVLEEMQRSMEGGALFRHGRR